jgi:hypothetical protein
VSAPVEHGAFRVSVFETWSGENRSKLLLQRTFRRGLRIVVVLLFIVSIIREAEKGERRQASALHRHIRSS